MLYNIYLYIYIDLSFFLMPSFHSDWVLESEALPKHMVRVSFLSFRTTSKFPRRFSENPHISLKKKKQQPVNANLTPLFPKAPHLRQVQGDLFQQRCTMAVIMRGPGIFWQVVLKAEERGQGQCMKGKKIKTLTFEF